MFLLIHVFADLYGLAPVFTFHNVSINTDTQKFAFLFEFEFTFHNVSINTYITSCVWMPVPNVFTFHNVSINTPGRVY